MKDQVSTKLSRREYDEVARLVKSGLYINTSDFVREAIRHRLEQFGGASLDPPDVIQERVYEYFKRRGGSAWPDEAALELGYSVVEVLDALGRLAKKGKAREVSEEVSFAGTKAR
jgi:Arc/MetJ-type ribon-helix-helix transcriptional regulator